MDTRAFTLTTADGRDLEVVLDGPEHGPVLVFYPGTPSGAVSCPLLTGPAARRGMRTVTWSRPGYGTSTSQPGRDVVDVVSDAVEVLDRLGADNLVTIGWSGGGPHALATTALLADRCRGAALIGGAAPYGADGLDWLSGMGPENLEEFAAAVAGHAAMEDFLRPMRDPLRAMTASQVAETLGELIDDVDRAAAAGELAAFLAASMRRAVATGTDGWRDDDLAFVKDWGFDVSSISRPVTIWQGVHDRMVPDSHGRWLAEHIPGATLRLEQTEGHLSLMHRAEEILDDLLSGQATAA
jgi:pimeloyl-ACP methyl ester carboxylesterase